MLPISDLIRSPKNAAQELERFNAATSPEFDLARDLKAYSRPFIYAQAVEMLLYWIKLIRASVLNNQYFPSFGPPIIRLKFGLLYDYISCIATKYSISYDESAGYDVVTLLPNKIKVNLLPKYLLSFLKDFLKLFVPKYLHSEDHV